MAATPLTPTPAPLNMGTPGEVFRTFLKLTNKLCLASHDRTRQEGNGRAKCVKPAAA